MLTRANCSPQEDRPLAQVPLIVRLAGLPVEVLNEFHSAEFIDSLNHGLRLHESASRCRSEIIDRTFSLLPGLQQATKRRLLLNIKRDCFNGRPISRYALDPSWAEASGLIGSAAEELLKVETALSSWAEHFQCLYVEKVDREDAYARSSVQWRAFKRGVALASPELIRYSEERRQGVSNSRRRKKLDMSLLRYLSRSVLKLSPFSTLTRIGLGSVTTDSRSGERATLGEWQERSMLRLKRYLLDQVIGMMFSNEAVREHLEVILNDTIEEEVPGRYRFLRASFWLIDKEGEKLRYSPAAMVKVNLNGPLVSWCIQNLDLESMTYGKLVSGLSARFGDGASRAIDRMLGVGFLQLLPPWRTNESHLEVRVLEFLLSLRPEGDLARLADVLSNIVEIEASYPYSENSASLVDKLDELLSDALRISIRIGGGGESVAYYKAKRGCLYEDVILTSGSGREPGIIELDQATVDGVLDDVMPVWRLSNLYNQRYDFLHAIGELMKRRWPGESKVRFLDLFGEAQALWRDYTNFEIQCRQPGRWMESFNPLEIKAVRELHCLREGVWREACMAVYKTDNEAQVDARQLSSILGRLPEAYRPPTGPCLFLQPIDARGARWVLNRMFDGTGRYGSRFTSVMDPEARLFYTGHFLAGSHVEEKGERSEFLDLMCAQGDILNVHAVQTPKVLQIPGERIDLDSGRSVRLKDLWVRPEAEGSFPRIVGPLGQEYFPVHLGTTNTRFMPVLLKFLALFGTGEARLITPFAPTSEQGDVIVSERLSIGRVVLRRRRWFFRPDVILRLLEGRSEAEAFLELHRWRTLNCMPETVFLIEKIDHSTIDDIYKPQYIDFCSPLFTAIFMSNVRKNSGWVVVEEVLPTPDAAASDANGKKWAFEIQLDTLALKSKSYSESLASDASDSLDAIRDQADVQSGVIMQPEPLSAH